jgi:hypothetical protein
MRNRRLFILVFAAIATLVPAAAYANNPPVPQALLGEALLAIALVTLTAVGGYYALLERKKPKRSGVGLVVIGLAMVVISLMAESCMALMTLIFAAVAMTRGVRMIAWSAEARRPVEPREPAPERARATRLLLAGVLLVTLTAVLTSWVLALTGWSMRTWRDPEIQDEIKKMVGYQLRYGETYRQQHGVVRFEPLDIGSIPGRFVFTDGDFNFPSHGREDEWDAQFLPGPSGRTFHVFVIPQGFPFFPYAAVVLRRPDRQNSRNSGSLAAAVSAGWAGGGFGDSQPGKRTENAGPSSGSETGRRGGDNQ